MVKGRIHSVESCGTVDGPGIRYIIFTQGCLLRCQYCHNADTWEIGKGKEITVEEVMQDVTCYIPFMETSGGGITVSGGEPLLQLDFLIELFKKCKEIGIHTTIDSSGGCYSEDEEFQRKLDILMEYTDLVLLDLKHIDSKKHRKLTGKHNEHILQFARYLSDKKKPIWVRHVLVPGVTDGTEDLEKLGAFIQSLDNVQKVEVLPYHKLGVYKWEALGHKYPLEGVEPPTEESVQKAKNILGAV
ncbi:pyruvate formate-lyase-activating protein [Bacillus multifaciens]|uniref:pyruvate formate-lyase-activating protein n=1 Tax=Bacillus multifaciens TaxID=3068506 RepID=UPI002741044A|nr:pyruvate formate-lyase-activating protein [Bacillus sp. WLY-B-L8]MDP7979884.1 pyruvate formate-lyase-activating protein [Bacillus sp. WLY-B-L8]HDX9589904.1 pyruvate formate lyase-activating protein [Bacillus pseudomycoides]